jgi:hypothetical protein
MVMLYDWCNRYSADVCWVTGNYHEWQTLPKVGSGFPLYWFPINWVGLK